ncbi:MAG TPA: adenosylcobinamide-phosphate synthase CbiB [Candidatus Polarisedimenticolaceae bacterium]|nr:adenosylcobinamide-phosphate synthase CbiB [Candidatus Polarisedimenticolaceae bacterium]
MLLALAIDLALGDPPNRYHPVAWLGRLLDAGRRRLCRGSPARLLAGGAALTVGVAALAGVGGALVSALADRLGLAGLVVQGIALSCLLSVRGLVAAAHEVASELGRGDLAGARRAVGYHLVSRPTAELDAGQVASATVESVAENLTDSLVAPALFFLAGGLAGAAVYRTVNTADAMVGYRDGPLEYFGKIAARLDDIFNLIPARLAALSLVAGALLVGESSRGALARLLIDRRRTASPNAGWTMAAMAGALGVRLEKPGAYRLGAGELPVVEDVDRSLRVLGAAVAVSFAVLVAAYLAIRRMTTTGALA